MAFPSLRTKVWLGLREIDPIALFGWGLLVGVVGAFFGYLDYRPATWIPGLLTELFAFAIGVLVVNAWISRREARKQMQRRERLKKSRELFAGERTSFPILFSLFAAHGVLDHCVDKGLSGGLEAAEWNAPNLRSKATQLRHHVLVYNAYLSPRTIMMLEQLQQSLDDLTEVKQPYRSADEQMDKFVEAFMTVHRAVRGIARRYGLADVLKYETGYWERVRELRVAWKARELHERVLDAMLKEDPWEEKDPASS